MKTRVTVLGGGLAGLFTASELLAAGSDDLVLLDRDSQPGGVARTIRRDGYELEPAATTLLLPKPHLTEVLDHLGAEVVAAIDGATRYLYTRGRLVTLPSSPMALLAPVVPWSAKLRAVAEPLVRARASSPDESLDDFMRRRLGSGLGTTMAWVAASGVFAGDPKRLSVRSAFPAFPALEDTAGSIVRGGLQRLKSRPRGSVRPAAHIPVGGMSALAGKAAALLGDRYRPGTVVDSVRRSEHGWTITGTDEFESEHVVIALRPSDAATLVEGDLRAQLERAATAPVVVVGLGGPSERLPLPPGFGVLTGPDAGTTALGILFESSYAPNRAPAGHSLAKVIAGGATRPDVVEWDDDRIIGQIGNDVSRILGIEADPSFVEIVRHRAGIPQYEVGHNAWLAELDRLSGPNLHLTGWGYRGVGVGHIAADAVRIATRIATEAST
jgi:oxygen-dependent protoporphyrinogen oxidase